MTQFPPGSHLNIGPSDLRAGALVWNAKDHGVAGNGTTVDSTALAALITLVSNSTYKGIIYLPPGVYVVSGLALASNVTLLGAGMGATVLQMDPAVSSVPVLRVVAAGASGSQIHVRNLTIDGNQSTYGSSSNARNIGYYLGASSGGIVSDCTVQNVEFRNCKSYGLDIEGVASQGSTVIRVACSNLYVHDNGFSSGTGSNISCDGITVIGDDITLTDCFAWNNSGNGIIGGQVGTVWHRIRVKGCRSNSNTLAGIKFGGGLVDSGIIGSSAYNNGVTAVNANGYGISLTGGTNRCSVVGNVCAGNYVNGIRIEASDHNTISANVCDGNCIRGAGDPEIYLTSTSVRNIVASNQVNASIATYGISEQNTASDFNIVTGNIVQTGGYHPQGVNSLWTNNL